MSDFSNTIMFKNYYSNSNNPDGDPPKIIPLSESSEYTTGSGDRPPLARFTSEDNIDDIDRLIEFIRLLLDRAYGEDSPRLVDQYPTNQDTNETKMPMIVYDYYDREYMEKTRKGPNIMQTIKDSEGSYDILSEFFECILQFDICSETTRSAKTVSKQFEIFLQSYIQYFKYVGISQMYFLREIKATPFLRCNHEYPRRSLLYSVRLERRYIRKPGEALTNVSVILGINSNIAFGSSSEGLPGIYNEFGTTLPHKIY